jgi:hypothetical protein
LRLAQYLCAALCLVRVGDDKCELQCLAHLWNPPFSASCAVQISRWLSEFERFGKGFAVMGGR